MTELGMTPDTTDRMKTAAATQGIVDQLSAGEQAAVVRLLAKAAVAAVVSEQEAMVETQQARQQQQTQAAAEAVRGLVHQVTRVARAVPAIS